MKELVKEYFEELAKNLFGIIATDSENKKSDFNQSLVHINFYVPSSLYGPVEIIHQVICHSIIDLIIETKK